MNKIIYLDSAASLPKPKSVLVAEMDFLENHYANSGRAICKNTNWIDDKIYDARKSVAKFINANADNIVFTGGATDGLNRIVRILALSNAINPGTRVLVSDLDHHSARLPWMDMANRTKCILDVADLNSDMDIDLTNIKKIDIFVITAMSNVLGRGLDIEKLIKTARKINPNLITIIDAAQYAAHLPIDVRAWDADFLCFAGHKIGANTGVGIMYIKNPDIWAPDKMGGGMVSRILPGKQNEQSKYIIETGYKKFEAGTLPLSQIVGLPHAISEINKGGHKVQGFIKYMYDELSNVPGIKIISSRDSFIFTFIINDMHCLDAGALISAHGVCLRAGNMCASWIHQKIGIDGSIRLSPGAHNKSSEISKVVKIIKKILEKNER